MILLGDKCRLTKCPRRKVVERLPYAFRVVLVHESKVLRGILGAAPVKSETGHGGKYVQLST